MGFIIASIRQLLTPESLRKNGVKQIIISILQITTIYRRVILVERNLKEPIPTIVAKMPVVVDLLQLNEVEDLAAFCARNYPTLTETKIRRRLSQGQLCFQARYNESIVHAIWVAFGVFSHPYLGLRIHLSSSEAYLYDAHTASEFRNRGAALASLIGVITYLHDAGYSFVKSDVIPPQKSRSTPLLGFQVIGWLARIVIGPIKLTLFKPIGNTARLSS